MKTLLKIIWFIVFGSPLFGYLLGYWIATTTIKHPEPCPEYSGIFYDPKTKGFTLRNFIIVLNTNDEYPAIEIKGPMSKIDPSVDNQ